MMDRRSRGIAHVLRALPLLIATAAATATATAQGPAPAPAAERPAGLLRDQAARQQRWLAERLDSVLPRLMREHGVDMWVVPMREYNEDPVFTSLVSPTTFAARRRTIYVFHDRCAAAPAPGCTVERIALGGTSQGGLYDARTASVAAAGPAGGNARANAELWGAEQWTLLREVVAERAPRRIAVNSSRTHAFADGLTAAEDDAMREALGPELAARLTAVDRLPLDLITLRLPDEAAAFRELNRVAWDVIRTAFSRAVITPGQTTTDDVVWWMRQRVNDLGLGSWFQPSVSVQRHGWTAERLGASPVIMPGDVLWCDFGITAMRLNTDTQHMGYVLREGETGPPAGLREALARSNRLQDIVVAELRPGRTGNEVLAAARARMQAEGLDGTVYSHPIGMHGHGAGPLVGLWDRQEGVPGRGDVPVLANSWFSIELQVTSPVPEWDGQRVRSAQEEDVVIGDDGVPRWALDRQTRFHLVGAVPAGDAAAMMTAVADSTPLERRAWDVARLIPAENGDYAAIFAPTFLAQVPPTRMAALFGQLRALGAVERIEVLEGASDTQGRVRLVTANGYGIPIQLVVSPDAPHLVTGIFIQPPVRLAGTLQEVTDSLRALPGQLSFLLARLEGDSLRTLAEVEPDRRLGIGSTFKLYILGELVRQVRAGERRWDEVVRLDSAAASLPSGILQSWPHDAPLTVQTLATLMISQSDNTATDALLRLAGRERVESVQAAMGHGQPSLNVPFLGTLELFALKGAPDTTLASRYVAASTAARRAILAEEVAAVPRDRLQPFADGQPSHIETIEWFASARELAGAMRWLRDATADAAGQPARALMAVNPGLAFGDGWRYVGFKGGSEPGVLNMTWLLESDDGQWYVMSAGWNDPAAAVDAARIAALLPRALELARTANQ